MKRFRRQNIQCRMTNKCIRQRDTIMISIVEIEREGNFFLDMQHQHRIGHAYRWQWFYNGFLRVRVR